MRTLGVDLASQPANTAICAISWSRTKRPLVEWIRKGIDDDALLGEMVDFEKVGVDAPLGWPQPFVRGIQSHAKGKPWPRLRGSTEEQTRALRMRATDAAVARDVGKWPLSVSADTLGVVAFRLARIQDALAGRGEAVDRSGRGTLCEVYPGAALTAWGLAGRSYKGEAGADRRKLILDRLRRTSGIRLARRADSRLAREDDDCLDALLCAMIARAAATGRTTLPGTAEEKALARSEGWIHVPTCNLDELEGPGEA